MSWISSSTPLLRWRRILPAKITTTTQYIINSMVYCIVQYHCNSWQRHVYIFVLFCCDWLYVHKWYFFAIKFDHYSLYAYTLSMFYLAMCFVSITHAIDINFYLLLFHNCISHNMWFNYHLCIEHDKLVSNKAVYRFWKNYKYCYIPY